MKRIFAVTMALVMLLSFTACGGRRGGRNSATASDITAKDLKELEEEFRKQDQEQ